MMQLGCHEMPCHCNVIPLMEVETLAAETCWATSARPQQTTAYILLCLYNKPLPILGSQLCFFAPQLESNS